MAQMSVTYGIVSGFEPFFETMMNPARRSSNQKQKVNHKSFFDHEEHEGHEGKSNHHGDSFFDVLRALRVLRGE